MMKASVELICGKDNRERIEKNTGQFTKFQLWSPVADVNFALEWSDNARTQAKRVVVLTHDPNYWLRSKRNTNLFAKIDRDSSTAADMARALLA